MGLKQQEKDQWPDHDADKRKKNKPGAPDLRITDQCGPKTARLPELKLNQHAHFYPPRKVLFDSYVSNIHALSGSTARPDRISGHHGVRGAGR